MAKETHIKTDKKTRWRLGCLGVTNCFKQPQSAITDPVGPKQTGLYFKSGANRLYLAHKTGQFCGQTGRDHIAVDQWLMCQMGGVGEIAGQAHHFLKYVPQWSHRMTCLIPKTATGR